MLVSLRNYSNYSICESNIKIDDLVNFASKNNLPSPTFLDTDSIANIGRFDLLYICTSLHYIENLENLFDKLLEGNPSFVILQKLLISTKDTQRFQQYFGKNSGSLNKNEVHSIIQLMYTLERKKHGFILMFRASF